MKNDVVSQFDRRGNGFFNGDTPALMFDRLKSSVALFVDGGFLFQALKLLLIFLAGRFFLRGLCL